MLVLVTYENYPSGSPGAKRNHSLAQAFYAYGYDTLVIHKGQISRENNIPQITLYRNNKYNKWLLFWWRTLCELRLLRKQKNIDAVVIYSCGLLLGKWIIKKWCNYHGIKVIFDVVEWYSKEQFKHGLWSIKYQTKQFENSHIIDKKCRVITISKYLRDYYEKKGCITARIPIICDKNIIAEPSIISTDSYRTMIYAGSHFDMDNIPLILSALASLPKQLLSNIKFEIFGYSEEYIKNRIGNELWTKIEDVVNAHGRQPNDIVMKAYKNADFTILLRNPNYRVNQAGFPSKVIESMSQGVAIMCNYSSDLKDFLTDGENAIIVNELDVNSLAQSISRIILLSNDDVQRLKLNSIETVKNKFCYEHYNDEIRTLLS